VEERAHIWEASETKRAYWGKRIDEQEASGQAVRPFCREHNIGQHSFYQWRKRLRETGTTVRFAMLETKAAGAELVSGAGVGADHGRAPAHRQRGERGDSALVLDAVRG